MEPQLFRETFARIEAAVRAQIVGQEDVVRAALIGVVAGGNVLLEGVPGLGKTVLVKSIGDALRLDFARIQFTPDLMPSDITGTRIVSEDDQGRRHFVLHRGPVFANVVLADEVNRATPKTQSALLEAMQERQVTIAGETHRLPEPFFVVATQNPLEMDGTYPLPEAQLDRFLFKIEVKFPTLADLRTILTRTTTNTRARVDAVCDGPTLLAMGRLARDVLCKNDVADYAIRLVLATHPTESEAPDFVKRYVRYGASPRGAQALLTTARIRALLQGREHVALEDLRWVAPLCLRHRILLNFEGEAEGVRPDRVVDAVLGGVRA